RLILAFWLIGCFAVGCQTTPRSTHPTDPLLAMKPPVEGKLESAPPAQVAYFEPDLPTVPGTPATRRSMAGADEIGADNKPPTLQQARVRSISRLGDPPSR